MNVTDHKARMKWLLWASVICGKVATGLVALATVAFLNDQWLGGLLLLGAAAFLDFACWDQARLVGSDIDDLGRSW